MWSSVALRGRAVPGIGPLRPFGLWYNRKTCSRTLRERGLYLLASGLGQPGNLSVFRFAPSPAHASAPDGVGETTGFEKGHYILHTWETDGRSVKC